MSHTKSLYETCRERFASYPLAARAEDRDHTLRSMVLLLQEGDDVLFFVLSSEDDEGTPCYWVSPWPEGQAVWIEDDDDPLVPDVIRGALTRGVPIPRHGSLFGWTWGTVFTALVVAYTQFTPERPYPRWNVMPLYGVAETEWPPFTGNRLLGFWFWEYWKTGNLVCLDELIAQTPDTIFWIDTWELLGSNCCVVTSDVTSPEGHTIRRGRYVFSEVLRSGGAVPSQRELLAYAGKVDLSSRFLSSVRVNTCSPGIADQICVAYSSSLAADTDGCS